MIAISYRREDSLPITGRLYDRLEQRFGKENVFMDFDSIRPGFDFRKQIEETIGCSQVVIAIIGPDWLGEKNDGPRRIDNPSDFVRLEIANALERNIPLMPVLVNNTPMPSPESLPPDIQTLAFRHALPLDTGVDFRQHADRIIAGVVGALPPGHQLGRIAPTPKPSEHQTAPSRFRPVTAVLIGLLAIGFAVGILYFRNQSPTPSNTLSPRTDTLRAQPNATPFEQNLHFQDGKIPNGWRIVVVGPGQNASIKNGQFEVDQVDTYAGLRTSVRLDKNTPLIIEYTGNVADVYWGMGEQARLLMKDGTIITAGLGKAGYGGNELSAVIGNSQSPQFTKALPPKFGVYRVKAKFENGRVTCSAIQWGKGTLFQESVTVPELKLEEVSEIELFASTTTGDPAWVRDVTISQ